MDKRRCRLPVHLAGYFNILAIGNNKLSMVEVEFYRQILFLVKEVTYPVVVLGYGYRLFKDTLVVPPHVVVALYIVEYIIGISSVLLYMDVRSGIPLLVVAPRKIEGTMAAFLMFTTLSGVVFTLGNRTRCNGQYKYQCQQLEKNAFHFEDLMSRKYYYPVIPSTNRGQDCGGMRWNTTLLHACGICLLPVSQPCLFFHFTYDNKQALAISLFWLELAQYKTLIS